MDLWVCDGVEQLPLLLAGEDELAQLLPVDLPVLQQDLWPKVVDDPAVGWAVGLHHCHTQRQEWGKREKEGEWEIKKHTKEKQKECTQRE